MKLSNPDATANDVKGGRLSMSMLKWASPFEEMELLRKEIDQAFNSASQSAATGFSPPVEVVEAENHYQLDIYLPGLPTENLSEYVNIEATQKTITVSGEVKPRELPAGEKTLISQFRYGKFYKQLSFPDGIHHENIEASYSNGILTLRLPKALSSQKKTIQIQVK
jgi:HSP20 family protein